MKLKKLLTVALLIFGVTTWASAFVGIRYALKGYQPGSLALLRYLVASAFVFLIYQKNKKTYPKPKKKDFPLYFLSGVLGIGLYNIALNTGEIHISAGITSFIVAQMPILTTLLAILFLKEAPKKSLWLGMILSIIGTYLIAISVHSSTTHHLAGFWLVIVATFSSAFYSVLQKPLLKRTNPIQLVSYSIWCGTLMLFIYFPELFHDIQHASIGPTLTVIYLGIFPGVLGYLIWTYALSIIDTSKASSVLYLSPFIATMLGWLLLRERPNHLEIIGGVIALSGAYVVNKKWTLVSDLFRRKDGKKA